MTMRIPLIKLHVTLLLLLSSIYNQTTIITSAAPTSTPPTTPNHAIILSTSRNWLNYRHTANALSIYQSLKHHGIPDSNIILMLADTHACDPRNARPGTIFLDPASPPPTNRNLYTDDIEVDYRGSDVTVENLIRILTDQHPPGTPPSKKLHTGPDSNILLYLTGHGGDEFLKFHDQVELLAADLGLAIESMYRSQRYKNILMMLDTCQAATMWERVVSPGVYGIASSPLGKSSYAHTSHPVLGTHTIDQFTYHLDRYLMALDNNNSSSRKATFGEALEFITSHKLGSEIVVRSDDVKELRILDFMGGDGGGKGGKGGGEGGYGEMWRSDVCTERKNGEKERGGKGKRTLRDALLAAGTSY